MPKFIELTANHNIEYTDSNMSGAFYSLGEFYTLYQLAAMILKGFPSGQSPTWKTFIGTIL